MTRINTNVSSLVAQNTLGRSNADLNQALTRLSTGLRINTGKDDPAGLIASENLRSDITSIRRAISNTDRANQVIATADSALGQVSSLLNDIRGLVTESANAGALSDEQISANQLQLDSSLEALNRIAQTTTFQGRRLLDGSLDFITSAGTNFTSLESLQIDQANLGATGSVGIDINVSSAATQASVDVGNIAAGVAAVNSSGSITFSDEAVTSSGNVTFDIETAAAQTGTGAIGLTIETADSTGAVIDNALGSGGAGTFSITAVQSTGNANLDGAAGDDIVVSLSTSGTPGSLVVTYDGTDAITVTGVVDTTTTATEIRDAINSALGSSGTGEFTVGAVSGGGTTVVTADVSGDISTLNAGGGAATTSAETLTITTAAGAGQDFDIQILTAASGSISDASGSDSILAGISGDASTGYTVTVASDATTDLNNLATFIQTQVGEAATVVYSGGSGEVLDLSRGADVAPSGVTSVAGSLAATVSTETIAVTGLLASGADGNIGISFEIGTVVGTGTNPQRVATSGNANDGYVLTIDDSEAVTFANIATAIAAISEVDSAVYGGGATFNTSTTTASQGNTTLANGRDAGDDVITITAATADASFDGTVTFNTSNATTGGIDVTVTDGDVVVSVDSTSQYNLTDIATAIDDQTDYSASLTGTAGSGTFDANEATDDTTPVTAGLTGGQVATGGLATDVILELAGLTGAEVLSFGAGTNISELISGINLVSDATGVSATANGTTLTLQSSSFGADSVVDLNVISEETGGTFTAAVGQGARVTGSDAVATINGVQATADGNQLSVNTATLDLATTVAADFTGTASFTITGGGALFQLGPDVVSNQQARLGIGSVNTAQLGGVNGKLFQLGTGGSAQLSGTNLDTAASIVEDAITQVTSLRGRLGAFQRTTLETNKQALNDTLVNLTDAESSIRDADFAAESAKLTRAQILVQSGTTVLSIANQNPQNVLALLR